MIENKANNIDEYISGFPKDIQILLEQIRAVVRKEAPEAQEVISYGMPAFKFYGILIYFAAFKNHIGFFPTASGIRKFQNELTDYQCSKGTIQLPYIKPLPIELIRKIVKFRVQENLEKAESKKKKQVI
jgi:uncharacterized protein YdhG (YjbR/CyaY superfamily)